MNKAPQPITGSPSNPHPAPSPGLSQPSFPSGQPPSVVFATPPPQMNPTPQPRQFAPGPRPIHQQGSFRSLQPYYTNRPNLPPSSGPRGIPPSSGPRPVTPTHVYQAGPGSQMMMIPGQQLPFPSSPQGPAYFIPGQYRSATYVATPQQYPVPAGTPGFYPGTSPAEYGTYAGAYYPAQPQFTPPVQPAPVIMNPAPQQQQPPPQPPQHIHTKRERKQIRIRDPNQGGRDITEEIMSGGRSGSTPTPPQTAISGTESTVVAQANGESVAAAATPAVVRPDDSGKPTPPPLSKTPELAKSDPIPTDATSSDTNTKPSSPPVLSAAEDNTLDTISTLAPSTLVADVMDAPPPPREPTPPPQSAPEVPAYPAPLPDPVPTSAAQDKMDKKATEVMEEEEEVVVKEDEAVVEEAVLSSDTSLAPSSTANGVTDVEPERLSVVLPLSQLEAPLESPIAQPEELRLPNGLPLPAPQDPEVPIVNLAEHDDSPIAEPDISQQPTIHTSAATIHAAPTPVVQAVPAAVDQPGPAATVQEIPSDPVVYAAPTQLAVKDTVPPVALDVKDETPVPQSAAEEEKPSPAETVSIADSAPETVPTPPPSTAEEREDTPPPQMVTPALVETTMQAAVSVPKKKRKMKDLNKKEAVGDLLDAFKEEQVVAPPEPESAPTRAPETQPPAAVSPAPEEADLTWEDKEDKLDAENIQPESPKSPSTDKKYQYKEEQWKPINPEEKKQYDREFLLGFQFISASMNKPEGLPAISDVVLDKANKTPLRQLDPSRLPGMNCGPDFTPSFANLGRPGMGGGNRGPPPGMGIGVGGPRRSQQMQRKEPRKIITTMSLSDDVQLNKAEKAWKPSTKKAGRGRGDEEDNDLENIKTQELFKRVRSILNKLTPQKFQQLMKQVTELTIDTEERLKGVIDLTFEKAISEPDFSVAYANMCRCLMGLKVQIPDKPGATVNFRKLLLNRCQKEFEKDKDDDVIFEKKQKELEAASEGEKQRLIEELQDSKDKARRRSLGNIKFIGELFKLKMLTEVIMHDCIVKLLKNHDEESLECLCRLLSTIGKDLDFEKAKPRMDQYFNQMEKIIKERKTSSRIRFMLQDVLDLRRNNWVPRRGDQGPKTIDQIHKEAEMEEHREQARVQQALVSKKELGGGPGGRMGGGGQGGRGGPHTPGRGAPPQDEGWNTVPISKNRPIDTSRLSKITKTPVLDFNNQLLAPGGKGTWGSWGKGSSGGTSTKPADSGSEAGGRPATSTLNRFSALQQPPSSAGSALDSDRRVPQRNSSSRERGDNFDRSNRGSDRFDRREERRDDRDRNRLQITKRSFSRENEERSREREQRGSADPVRRVASMTDDRDRSSRERARSKENAKRETATPPPSQTPTKPALTEEELSKKSTAIIEEYLHINDMKEALQCVQEMNSTELLFVFVRNGLESTLERSTIAREHMGLLLHQLIKTGTLPTLQYYKGLQDILEVAEDMAIDIPHIWLYLAELITPMLHEGGIPMGELFREISKPLIPLGKAGVLLVQILTLLCNEMSHKKAGTMWREAGLGWKEFLPEDEDVNKFVTEQNVEFTMGDESEKSKKKELNSAELTKQLDKLIQDQADNQRIFDWVEANLDEQQTSSNLFVRALMMSVCQSAVICENPYKMDSEKIKQRAKLLQKYLKDEQKELQALYALQALMVQMEQPANLLRMFFDSLYDEDVIKEEAFYKWESSKDPAEQQGKGVALKSVTAFFTWLREAEDESDNS
ncbi:eukaryotic translation initiation factor 4 gamma 1-like isoform X1 [Acanthopagrus latus]|uniref:eukaryotic translation initiation factor 4 gamma 1-like isoform X1 n=2 Tax=Acanthopagrus latus TaxID=8177 RepID=UPI00187BDD08|nr:eukaryotic translation initiation factor 4 gamma 1-like isoform X1 [Acanthopagrus latus]XP_036928839.1 eukaryotic translation initiation factor 4 gamma 1-like isoform X1 [Acanthopagrus latus]XP_036928848.1 eukaryotic translation initiation factor 4 gamma 1-like isoform X1 [Acanthopagrus latus]